MSLLIIDASRIVPIGCYLM